MWSREQETVIFFIFINWSARRNKSFTGYWCIKNVLSYFFQLCLMSVVPNWWEARCHQTSMIVYLRNVKQKRGRKRKHSILFWWVERSPSFRLYITMSFRLCTITSFSRHSTCISCITLKNLRKDLAKQTVLLFQVSCTSTQSFCKKLFHDSSNG